MWLFSWLHQLNTQGEACLDPDLWIWVVGCVLMYKKDCGGGPQLVSPTQLNRKVKHICMHGQTIWIRVLGGVWLYGQDGGVGVYVSGLRVEAKFAIGGLSW
jgi:hypothetical protein